MEETLEERPKASSLRPIRAILPFLRPYRGLIAGALVAMAIAAAATLTLPAAARLMIDTGFSSSTSGSIDQYFAGLFIVACIMGWAAAVRFYLVSRLGERVVADIRDALFSHLLYLSPAFYERTKAGEISSRLTTDTTLVQTVVGSGLSIALRSFIMLVGSAVLLVVTSPRLALITAGVIPLVLLPIIILGRRVRRESRDSQDRLADTSALAAESIAAISAVQSFVQEKPLAQRFGKAVERAFRAAMARIRTSAILTAMVVTVVFGAIVFVLWLGARDVSSGLMSGGELSQFVLYAVFAASTTGALSEVWGDVQRAAGAMERITELLQAQGDIATPAQPIAMPDPPLGQVAMEEVTFHYPSRPQQAALEDFSLQVGAGETVALVGPSGAGKSTVFQLLLRFYDAQQGTVSVDGRAVQAVDLAQLRSRIGIVPQDTVIFSSSALDNIRFAAPQASEEAVIAAAKAAEADEFIRKLPEGYHTHLGERGVRLSGGQRQRIAIARVILKNPPILLLDEATSALDSESELLVHRALDSLMQNRTTVVIAHRLATVTHADRIAVIEDGRLVEQGQHQELLDRQGRFARLAKAQFSANQRLAGQTPETARS